MHPLEKHTLKIIHRDKLLQAGQVVLAAVSGGPDSTGLLHVLAALAPALRIRVVAMYVDHSLRPAEAEKERLLVESLAAGLGAGFESSRVDTRQYAKKHKLSLEHAARDLRYERLRQTAAAAGAQAICVAHTADDQVEEILLRLLRGSGRKGLAGMATRNNDIVRPFLFTEKKVIMEYLAQRRIQFCEDSMNSDMRYLRSRVRHKLLPYLEQHFDRGVRQALCKSADSLAEDEVLLAELTTQAYRQVVSGSQGAPASCEDTVAVDRPGLCALPKALQRRVVEQLLWNMGARATYDHIMAILAGAASGRTGAELHLSRGLRVGIRRDCLEFIYPRGKTSWRGRLYANNE